MNRNQRDELLRRLAEVIRVAYIRERRCAMTQESGEESQYDPHPRWNGGRNARGEWSDSAWLRAARLMLELGVNYENYLRYLFYEKRMRDWPQPNLLHSRDCLAEFQRQSDSRDRESLKEIRLEHDFGWRQLTSEMLAPWPQDWSKRMICEHVLLSDQLQCSALFRYCVAKRYGLRDIAAEFRDAAEVQYLTDATLYDRVWGDLIPERLKELARDLLPCKETHV